MTRRTIASLAILTTLLIFMVGVAYTIFRPSEFESTASLSLTPTPEDPADTPSVLESFVRSGTAGTYVALIGSRDTLAAAGAPPVDVTVRSIPDSRIITVTATGDEEAVQPAVTAIVAAAGREEDQLRDVWSLQVVERAGPAVSAGPGAGMLLFAALVIALMGGALVVLVLRRLAVAPPAGRSDDTEPVVERTLMRAEASRARTAAGGRADS